MNRRQYVFCAKSTRIYHIAILGTMYCSSDCRLVACSNHGFWPQVEKLRRYTRVGWVVRNKLFFWMELSQKKAIRFVKCCKLRRYQGRINDSECCWYFWVSGIPARQDRQDLCLSVHGLLGSGRWFCIPAKPHRRDYSIICGLICLK